MNFKKFLSTKYKRGSFGKKFTYLKIGTGSKKLIIFPSTYELLMRMVSESKINSSIYSYYLPDDYSIYVFGYSKDLFENYTPIQLADEFATIIKSEFGPVDIMGISYGGFISIPFAAKYPKLCKKLLLCATAYCPSEMGLKWGENLVHMARKGKIYSLLMKFNDLFKRKRYRWLVKLFIIIRWKSIKKILNPISTFINAYAQKEDVDEIRKTFKELLPRIKAPSIIIGGTEDQFFSKDLYRETASLIPNSQLILLEGESHMIMLEKMKNFRLIIQKFLS